MIYNTNKDKIEINLNNSYKKIGVMISGGIDSALLYYLLLLEKKLLASNHIIYPIVMFRQEGSKFYSRPLVEKINSKFGINVRAKKFGDSNLPNELQLASAVKQASYILQLDQIYIGVIQNRPEHLIGYTPIPIPINDRIITPFIKVEKDSIVKLFYTLQIEDLLAYTFSCDVHELNHCRKCNGCRERQYGFEANGLTDPNF